MRETFSSSDSRDERCRWQPSERSGLHRGVQPAHFRKAQDAPEGLFDPIETGHGALGARRVLDAVVADLVESASASAQAAIPRESYCQHTHLTLASPRAG